MTSELARGAAMQFGALACSVVLAACAGTPARLPAAPAAAPARCAGAAAGRAAPAFSSLVASRRAAVVDISTLRIGRDAASEGIEPEIAPEHDFADRLAWPLQANVRLSQVRDLASGLVVSADGLILTSAHVIMDIDEAQVQLDDGRRFMARVVGADRRTDVGLLKIDAVDLPHAVIGDSTGLAPGDWVAAISSPFGFHGSVTAGVVSAVDRVLGGAGDIPFIQSDVAINPGSSGSPLFNGLGEVVGINSMIYSGSGGYMGLSFAVPINLVMQVARQLQTDGRVRRAYLGAAFQVLTPELAQSFALPPSTIGALVVRVDDDSPAKSAGLAQGDALVAINGRSVSHYGDLPQLIGAYAPGATVSLEVWRGGRRHVLRTRLSEQSESHGRPAVASAEWSDGLGLTLTELSAAARRQMRIPAGLTVRESAGLARSEGIRAGDVIVALNTTPLSHVEEFRQALAHAAPSRPVALLVMRDARLAYVAVQRPAAPPAGPTIAPSSALSTTRQANP